MKYLLFISVFVLFSCQSEKNNAPPKNLIPKQKFIALSVDMHIADIRMTDKMGEDFDNKENYYGYYKWVFEKHQVTPEAYRASFEWYAQHHEDFYNMYSMVKQKIQAEMSAVKPVNSDTLKNN